MATILSATIFGAVYITVSNLAEIFNLSRLFKYDLSGIWLDLVRNVIP